MSRFYAKMRLKSAPKELNFLMAKAIWKSYQLHSKAVSFSIKTILCENTNILFKIKVRLLWTVFKILFTSAIMCI